MSEAAALPKQTEARVIVKYRADSPLMRSLAVGTASPPQHAASLSSRLGLSLTDGRTLGERTQVIRGQGLSSSDLVDRLGAQSDVEYAVIDGIEHALAAPNDPRYPGGQTTVTPTVGQWYLRAPTSSTIVDATSVVSAINAEAAWNVTTGSSAIVVADLDTGVRFDHPDLTAKLYPGYDFVNAAISNDGDGADADASDPGTYQTVNGQVVASLWHGTQTAGLIGALTNNGSGMASAGRDVMVLPVRVLGAGGTGYDSDIIAGMLWAGGLSTGLSPEPGANPHPARVINMSLGSSGSCIQPYIDAIASLASRNVVVLVAGGNSGLAVGTPANCPGVIAVAGVRHAGTKVGYSDLGPEIAISAPAGNCVNSTGACLFPILTTSNSGTTTPVSNAAGGSIYTDGASNPSLGTSFSTPLVAGTVGLMLSANPALTVAQVRSYLQSSARPFPATGGGTGVTTCTAPTAVAQASECYCTTSTCGAGLLDAGAAVAAAAAVAQATATISVASNAVTVGSAVTLDGSGSRSSSSSGSIAAYQWSIASGASSASLTSATNASTVTLLPSAAGTVVVSLTVTDSVGKSASTSTTLTVSAAAVVTPTPTSGSSSGGGGGALEPAWLLAWLAAIAAVRAVSPSRTRSRRR